MISSCKTKPKKKPVKCLISIRYTAESHTDVTACVLPWMETLLETFLHPSWAYHFCMKLHACIQSGPGAGKTDPGEVLEKGRQIWLPFFASFQTLNFCEEYNRYCRAQTHFFKQKTAGTWTSWSHFVPHLSFSYKFLFLAGSSLCGNLVSHCFL